MVVTTDVSHEQVVLCSVSTYLEQLALTQWQLRFGTQYANYRLLWYHFITEAKTEVLLGSSNNFAFIFK